MILPLAPLIFFIYVNYRIIPYYFKVNFQGNKKNITIDTVLFTFVFRVSFDLNLLPMSLIFYKFVIECLSL